ncbi:macro domain-containing protein [Aureivirga marina]|uniref:macro domain-containing protein n=1 Tax=Aureivirga marina TaxID=1182451 RepID=UPI0018C90A31|nr:macro domain-containing protein [Aureivirga marina]
MKYTLISNNPEMVVAWKKFFRKEENVEILEGNIITAKADAIVSPANSFGFMDGGVDLAISMHIGWHVEDELRKRIQELPEGELLIGNAMVIETNHKDFPYLISAPSMRVPMSFNIATSVNTYLAMKATLITAKNHSKIESLTMTSFCTGTGRMNFEIAAHQMYEAFLEIEKGKKKSYKEYGDAQKYQYELNPKGMIFDY